MYNGYELNNSSGTFAKIRWERESFRDLERTLEPSDDNGGPILIKNTFLNFSASPLYSVTGFIPPSSLAELSSLEASREVEMKEI